MVNIRGQRVRDPKSHYVLSEKFETYRIPAPHERIEVENVIGQLEYPICAMWQQIQVSAERYPDNIALEYFDTKITYRELMEKMIDIAKTFKNSNVQKGDHVVIAMANSIEGVAGFYAANMVGAIPNMVHPNASKKMITSVLQKSKAKHILALTNTLETIDAIMSENAEVDNQIEKVLWVSPKDSMTSPLLKVGYDLLKGRKVKKPKNPKFAHLSEEIARAQSYTGEYIADVTGHDMAVVIYSGGTLSDPKAILHTNNSFNSQAISAVETSDYLMPGKKMAVVIPIFHGFGLEFGIHTPLTQGMHVILLPEPDLKRLADIFRNNEITAFIGVPKLYERMITSKHFHDVDFSALEVVLAGGSSLSARLKNETETFIQDRGSIASVREGYGLAQTIAGVYLNPDHDSIGNSIGCPLPDYYGKIVKPGTTEEVMDGEVGELCIYGPSLMSGYMGDEEETKKDLVQHPDGFTWLHTKDLAMRLENGYVRWIQRADNIISTREGYLINPLDVENAISDNLNVSSSTAFGVSDQDANQQVVVCIVLDKSVPENVAVDSIYGSFISHLAVYEIPRRLILIRDIPLTLVGKPDNRALKTMLAGEVLDSSNKVYRLTRNGYEKI